ncbi:MAG: triose-phosphate isomerase [bacterium]|nr:triose-phosphate isomerase [bacterium]
MKKIIIANWKMNPKSLSDAVKLAQKVSSETRSLRNAEVVLAPPFVYMPAVAKFAGKTKKTKLAVQNVFYEKGPPAGGGAYTGEVSLEQVKQFGAGFVIVGHSERRAIGETDEIIQKKLKIVLEGGLKAILCIGEKERNKEEAFPVIMRHELHSALLKIKKSALRNLIVAYEPIWAIGTGHAETPEHAFEITILIRRDLYKIAGRSIASKIPIIYGGSVTSKNAASFIKDGGMDGLLVGSASLLAQEFVKIVKGSAEAQK